jgi:hypothetical protein
MVKGVPTALILLEECTGNKPYYCLENIVTARGLPDGGGVKLPLRLAMLINNAEDTLSLM